MWVAAAQTDRIVPRFVDFGDRVIVIGVLRLQVKGKVSVLSLYLLHTNNPDPPPSPPQKEPRCRRRRSP